MEIIPSIDMKAIEKSVYEFTEGKLSSVHDGKAMTNGVYVTTPEDYLMAYTKYDRPISHEEVVKTLTCLLKAEVLDAHSERLCHLLIDNPRYSSKMKFIFDGSYRNNRIWFDHEKHLYMRCLKSYKDRSYVDCDNKTVKQQLNWMWNHYDVIYFQVPLYKTVTEVLEDIQEHRELRWC